MTLNIRTLEDGEIVTESGAYRCSMAWYHSQEICPGPSVSSTGLRKIAMQSPLSFWKTWDGNPDRYPEKPISDSLILGRAAHALILGDEVFDEHFIFVPEGAPQRPTKTQIAAFERDGEWSENAAPRAKFWEDFDKRASGRLLLKEEQVQKIQYMSENLAANPLAVEVLTSQLVEISLIWEDPQTGIWIKSRPDCLPSNGYDFGDLKTFAPKGANLILSAQRAITDHGYAMQMALAAMGAEAVLGTTAERCALVFIQSSEPYEVIPISLNEDAMEWGRIMCRHGINKMHECLQTGEWPGIGAEAVTYGIPPTLMDRLVEIQNTGNTQ